MLTMQEILDSINTERIEGEINDRRDMKRLGAGADSRAAQWVAALAESWERRLAEMDTLKTTDYIEGCRDTERRCLRELRSCAESAATTEGT